MLRVHTLPLRDVAEFEDDSGTGAPRLALAGGSDRRPPDDPVGSARIIPFPRERVRPGADGKASPDGSDNNRRPPAPPAESAAASDEPYWPTWMAHVLTRYRTPDEGGRGPTGIFI